MKYDIHTISILILAMLIIAVAVLPHIIRLLSRFNKGRKSFVKPAETKADKQQDDIPFPVVQASAGNEPEHYAPGEDELEHIEECVSGDTDSCILEPDLESDYSVILLANVSGQRFRDAVVGLMRSRMQFTDLAGNPVPLERILSCKESPKKTSSKRKKARRGSAAADPAGQREERIDEAIRKLGKKKKR